MEDLKNSPLFNQKVRERVLTLLYEKEFRDEPLEELNELLYEDTEPPSLGDEAVKMTKEIINKRERIDKIIKKFLEHWDFERISSTDKEALRIGIYELIYRKDFEPKVVIDRIVRISKKFGEEDSGKFVNGILGAVYRNYIEKDDKGKKDNN
jgi:N utilization substance protein B